MQTDALPTRANPRLLVLNAQEDRREQREKNGGMRAWKGDFRRAMLKRPCPETAPTLGGTGEKNQPRTVGFSNSGGAGGNRTPVRKSSTGSSTYLVLSFDLTALARTNTLQDSDPLSFRATCHGATLHDPICMTSGGFATLAYRQASLRTAAIKRPVRNVRR